MKQYHIAKCAGISSQIRQVNYSRCTPAPLQLQLRIYHSPHQKNQKKENAKEAQK